MVKIKSNFNIIYYAHSLKIYDTEREKSEITLINNNYPNSLIINPNGWIEQNMTALDIMKQCYLFAGKICNMIIFSADKDNILGKGVYDEIKKGIENNKKILYLNNNIFINFSKKNFDDIEMLYNKTGSWKKYAKVVIYL